MKKSLIIIVSSIALLNSSMFAVNGAESTKNTLSKFNAYLKKSAIETQKNYEGRLRALATLLYWQLQELNPDAEANLTCATLVIEANEMIKGLAVDKFKSVEAVIDEIIKYAPPSGSDFIDQKEYYNEKYQKIKDLLPKGSKFLGADQRNLPNNLD